MLSVGSLDARVRMTQNGESKRNRRFRRRAACSSGETSLALAAHKSR